MVKILLPAIVGALASIGCKAALPDSPDRVPSLWQMPDLSFGLYSGMLQIPATQKQLHYVAAFSQSDWTKDPVLLWFNGGPGCSSMLGWTQEHGPYVIEEEQTTFVKNKYSWNTNATVIYFDSPAGVGYSVCGLASECEFTDANSAEDNLEALLVLMTEKFPQLQTNDLYIAGESYAGIYVPTLAKLITEYKPAKEGDYIPNLKGIIVGNPVTDYLVDGKVAQFEMAYWYGLIDDQLYNNVKTNCNLSYWDFNAGLLSPQCKTWMNTFNSLISGINHYDFLGKCYIQPQPSSGIELLAERMARPHFTSQEGKRDLQSKVPVFSVDDYTPFDSMKEEEHNLKIIPNCVYVLPNYYYLNNRTIMDALHIPKTVTKWDVCMDKGDLQYTKSQDGSIDIYPELKAKNLRMLVYSGDTDGVISTYGTKAWIDYLNWPIKDPWVQFFVDGQVGGYWETRNPDASFYFATIHGAGHMAPQQRRSYTYHALYSFLNKTPF